MIGSSLFSGFYKKSEKRQFANLPASVQDEIADAMSATSKTDIR
ncbi:hypothetical protein [Demequina zhanjiangensis]|uniref:Uncharacterized protein n=1 Tax=Demequina zhanjiangensis TaxID=3051659 RepID=A0ABT8FYQ9_9MICO|nr:hypothetical protein [Demequina sp. SYSU T00b26]MDN4472035.1 hypothetical protein [Demequina sp. SYSU T00b26]